MAIKRHFAAAAVAVVLLLCLSSASAASVQATDPKAVDEALNIFKNSKSAERPALDAAAVKADSSSNPAAASQHAEKSAAAVSEPQHAPQFPEDPSLVRKGQEDPSAPAPKEDAPKQQLPAPTPAAAAPAAEAPKAPAADTPAVKTPAPAEKQQQAAKPEPKADAPKPDTPTAVADVPKAAAPKTDTPSQEEEVVDAFEDGRRKQQAQKEADEKVAKESKDDPVEKKEEENICNRVPGCMECKPFDAKAKFEGWGLRRLQQREGAEWDMGSMVSTSLKSKKNDKGNKINFDIMDMVDSPYNAKDLPTCTSCNTTAGYVVHSKGRCACKPGFGDTTPTGSCNKCPNGYFSLGGFRAVCVECNGVAFSNSDHTACVCASGWYGVTSYATKQASCNQCPGSRPVSPEGARTSSECFACPEGEVPNEIYGECVDPSKIPEPVSAPVAGEQQEYKSPEIKPLFNSTTFADTRKDWNFTTRNTDGRTNPLTDLMGSIMDSVMTNKNVTATAKTPGDLLYQMISKPAAAAPKLPNLPNIDMQNPAQLGAGLGAALATVPGLLGAAVQNGGKISDVVDGVTKAVETGSKAAGSDMAGATGNPWDSFLKGLSSTAPKDTAGKSELADFAKSLGNLFGAAGKVATEVAAKSDNSLVQQIGGMLSAAQKGEVVEVPLSSEAALIAAPEPAKAPEANSWSGMLSNMLGGQPAAATPAPAAAAEAPAAGNEWTKLLSGLAVKPDAAAAAPAAAAPPAGSSGDIMKLLAGLTAPPQKEANGNGIHTITAPATKSAVAPESRLSNTAVTPDMEGDFGVTGLLKELSKYKSSKTETHNMEDTHTTTQHVTTKGQQDAAGSLTNLLGGLFGAKNPGTKSFSFANPNGQATGLGDKLLKLQAQGHELKDSIKVPASASGFISVPSAPPKGSTQIKSGKFFANGKAKAMKAMKNKSQ